MRCPSSLELGRFIKAYLTMSAREVTVQCGTPSTAPKGLWSRGRQFGISVQTGVPCPAMRAIACARFPWTLVEGAHMTPTAAAQTRQVVALFNASDDTVEMVQRMLDASGFSCLVGCHFSDLKKGRVDFARYLEIHEPEVVIFDIPPPYRENWRFFKTL